MWTVTYTGKRMPLDPDPHPDGNVAVVDSPGRRIAIVLTKDELVEARELGRDLFMPHHATCEKVEMFR